MWTRSLTSIRSIRFRIRTRHFQNEVLEPYGSYWSIIFEDIMYHIIILKISDQTTLYKMAFNSLAPGRCPSYLKFILFELIPRADILSISPEIVLRWMPKVLYVHSSSGSGNGLVPSGSKQSPKAVLTQIYVTILQNLASFKTLSY